MIKAFFLRIAAYSWYKRGADIVMGTIRACMDLALRSTSATASACCTWRRVMAPAMQQKSWATSALVGLPKDACEANK